MCQTFPLRPAAHEYGAYACLELAHVPGALHEAFDQLVVAYLNLIKNRPQLSCVIVSESALVSLEDKELLYNQDYLQAFHDGLQELSHKLSVPILLCCAAMQQQELIHELYVLGPHWVSTPLKLEAGRPVAVAEIAVSGAEELSARGFQEKNLYAALVLCDEDSVAVQSWLESACYDEHAQFICFDARPYRFQEFLTAVCKTSVPSPVFCYNRGLFGRQLYYHPSDKHGSYRGLAEALIYALREYYRIHRLQHYLVGVSGGIDSALVLGLAWAAVGSSSVIGLSMPGPYSSHASYELAAQICRKLELPLKCLPLGSLYQEALHHYGLVPESMADQNLQARLRGLCLMSVSNAHPGSRVLNTTNKSEAAMGYSTLYGDTIGAFAPLSDLFKTEVVQLAYAFNELMGAACIPEEIITRPPSAELAPGQSDEESLGVSYPELDRFLRRYLESCAAHHQPSFQSLTEQERSLRNILHMMSFKRLQEPSGPQLSMIPLHEFDLSFAELMYPFDAS